jgi:two-component system OmpR family response regulator
MSACAWRAPRYGLAATASSRFRKRSELSRRRSRPVPTRQIQVAETAARTSLSATFQLREDHGVVRVLVIEDDARMAAAVRRGLRGDGLIVDVAREGEQALRMARATSFDAVVLDVMLPGADGFEVCRRLRADGIWSPVIMLTARDAVEDRVHGLDSGADDYLTKPFSLAELLARLRALVRRGDAPRPTLLEAGDLRLDPAARRVWRGDTEIDVSAREFGLLETFMRTPGRVFSQFELLESAWDLGYEQRSNVVEVYVGYLRQKIDRPFGVRSLETVRGLGYRLRPDGGRP